MAEINISGGDANAGDGGNAHGGDVDANIEDRSETHSSNKGGGGIPWWVYLLFGLAVLGVVAYALTQGWVIEAFGVKVDPGE